MRSYLSLAKADQVPLDTATLSYIADQRMKRAMVELQMSSGSLEMLDRALSLARNLAELPFDSESLAGAKHLVRNPAHFRLCAHRIGCGRTSALGEGFQRAGRMPHHRHRSHSRRSGSRSDRGCGCGLAVAPAKERAGRMQTVDETGCLVFRWLASLCDFAGWRVRAVFLSSESAGFAGTTNYRVEMP